MKTIRQNRLITNVLLLLVTFTGVLGRLTEAPKNSVILKEKTAVFTCCSDIPKLIFWRRKPTVSPTIVEINGIHGLVNGFLKSGRFNVSQVSSKGCHSLLITNIKLEDAGTYYCADEAGLGHSLHWELVTLESFECKETNLKDEYMGVNNFGLPQDAITISCISKYLGNTTPKTICEWSSGTKLHDNYRRFTKTNSTLTLNIQLPATKEINKKQLYCYVEIESSDNQNLITWTSNQFIVNYALFQQKLLSQCNIDELSLDCRPPCEYEMKQFSNGSQYCKIAYPSKTPDKVYVSLQNNNVPGTTVIPSSANKPVEIHGTLFGPYSIVCAVTIVIAVFFLGLMVGIFIFYCKMSNGPSGTPPTEVNTNDSFNSMPETNASCVQQNTVHPESINNTLEKAPFLLFNKPKESA